MILRTVKKCILATIILISTSHLSAHETYNPIESLYPKFYHKNGLELWDGDPSSIFIHDNGELAWRGPLNTDRDFYYNNSQRAWQGYINKEARFSYDPCTVCHKNGTKAWLGATNAESNSSYSPCTIYHNNGKKAWLGATNAECSSSYNPCTLYHGSGNKVWLGATYEEAQHSYSPCTFYHSNGSVAWRGGFAKDKIDAYGCSVYYENGQLAWSGKSGDPLYTKEGKIQLKAIMGLNLHIGDDSWLSISAKGIRVLHLHLGDGCYLIVSNQDDNPILSMFLGTGLYLNFFPHSGNLPQLGVYGITFEINYNKWAQNSDL